MEIPAEATHVYRAPKPFDYAALFEEASRLDDGGSEGDRCGGELKRPHCLVEDSNPGGDPACERADTDKDEGQAAEPLSTGSNSQNEASGKRNRRGERRQKRRRHEKAEEGHPARPDVSAKYVADTPLMDVEVLYADLPVSGCGYHGKKEGEEARRNAAAEDCSVEALLASGCTEIEWDGVTPTVIVERGTDRIVVVLAGRPNDPSYIDAMLRATSAILSAGEAAKFTEEELSHDRAENSAALNFGLYHGGGTKKAGNLSNGRHTAMMKGLVANPDLSRMAAFADAAFKLWSPEVYDEVHDLVKKLCVHNKLAIKNWSSNAYPCAALNFGPQVRCKPHKDSGNSPKTLCAIQAFGKFDPRKGGHLYIRELHLIIRFPAGSTILIPSALLTHGNTPVGPGETRLSFTQFVPGGLFRYVDNGFKTEDQLRRKSKKEYRKKMEEKAERWKDDLAKIPTLKGLKERHASLQVLSPSTGRR